MDRKALIERLAELGLDPKHYFVSTDSAMLLHNIPRKAGNDIKSVQLVVSPSLFEKLKQKNGLAPAYYKQRNTVSIAPDVTASSKNWDTYRNSVQLVDNVPVLRLGKLLHYARVIEGKKGMTDVEAIENQFARTMVNYKSIGQNNRQIGDKLGISEGTVFKLAKSLLNVSSEEWTSLGQFNPDFVISELEANNYSLSKVGHKLLPKVRDSKAMLSRVINKVKGRDASELLSTHEVQGLQGKRIRIQQAGYEFKKPKGRS